MGVSRRALLALAPLGLVASMTGASAAPMSFSVKLTGAQQVPPVQTTGSGTANITYDPATQLVTWAVTFSGLSGDPTMAHFHNGAEGKNGPVVVWLTVKGEGPPSPFSGSATLTPAQAAQFMAGDWYINVHTKAHPAGEIRGQVVPPKS